MGGGGRGNERRQGESKASVGILFVFFFQAEDGIRDTSVTGVQTCALPILASSTGSRWSTGTVNTRSSATTSPASVRIRTPPVSASGSRSISEIVTPQRTSDRKSVV